MDQELREFLVKMSDSIERSLHREIEAFRQEFHAELRDVREEVRGVKTGMREMSERISSIGSDYREARRARDIRTISVESRLEELERRMSEYENGRP